MEIPWGGPRPTASIRCPWDWPRLYGIHTGPRGGATHPRRPHEAHGTCHASTAAKQGAGMGHAPTVAIGCPEGRQRPHGGHTRSRGRATPPRQPYEVQGTGHDPMATIRGLGDGERPTATIWGPGDGPRPYGNQYGAQGTGHATTAAIHGQGD